MQVTYINLARRTDRRAFMEEQCARLGLVPSRIEALPPEAIAPELLERYCNPNRGGTLYPTALSCRLAHLAAAHALLETGAPFALVLEDDAILSRRLATFLGAFEASPGGIDLLRLETDYKGIRYKRAERSIEGIEIVRPWSWEPGAAGYILSRRAAEAFTANPQMRRRNDFSLFNPYGALARQVTMRQTIPALVVQAHHLETGAPDFGSDNHTPAKIPFPWSRGQRIRRYLASQFEREVIIAPQRLLHRALGAKRRSVEFLAD